MKKLTEQDGKSLDVVNANLEALKAIFPEAFTEDGVDFEVLRQLLGDVVDEGEEKYGLTWHVLKDLPKEWNGVVVMDWSDGFWDKGYRLRKEICQVL